MPIAYVMNEHLDIADRTAIEAAVRAARCEPVHDVPSDASELDPNADVGVIGLPVLPEEEAAANAKIRAFAGTGVRVVCIWLHGEESGITGVVPEGVSKYGVTVDIGSPKLIGALKGAIDVWEAPGGASRPAPITKRNKCV